MIFNKRMFFKYHYTDKDILMYYTTHNKKNVYVYNGQNFKKITAESLDDRIRNAYSYPEILVWQEDRKACMQYNDYVENIKHLSKITDINMFRTGSLTNTVKWLFNKFKPDNINPDKIEEYEFQYIMYAGGGVRVSEKYEGIGYKYDICSFYPSLMDSKILKIPIKRGILTTIDQEEFDSVKYFKYGIYNVQISFTKQDRKAFTILNSNMYTHYELNYAKKIGMNIKVLGQHMLFDSDSIVNASTLFGEYINYLKPYKYDNPIVKKLLNLLWGTLVTSSGGLQNVISTIDDFELQNDGKLVSMTQIDDTLYKFKINNPIKSVCEYARLKPFLLGLARTRMHQTFSKIGYDSIKFSHTDSLICSRRLHNNELKFNSKDTKIFGNWDFEGYDPNCVVSNSNQYKFNN